MTSWQAARCRISPIRSWNPRGVDVLPASKARGFLLCRSRGIWEGSCFAGSCRGEPSSYYSTRNGAEHDHFRAQREAFDYFPTTDEIARRAIPVPGELAHRGQHRSVSIPDLIVAATAKRFSQVADTDIVRF